MRKVKVGVIGTGMISTVYLKNLTGMLDHIVEVKAVADMVPELAQKKAEEFGVPNVYTVEELLADPEIEIVLNLTAPAAHAPLNLRALEAGKHVYTEKPFALTREDADEVLALAESKNLLVGCAPDTFLGAGIQTCVKLINDGWIGTPYGASATIIMGNAAGGMHPNFRNFLKLGGDPIMDMGPYYLTALIALLGPVQRVTGSARQLHQEAVADDPKSPAFGQTVPVEAPTNVSAVLTSTAARWQPYRRPKRRSAIRRGWKCTARKAFCTFRIRTSSEAPYPSSSRTGRRKRSRIPIRMPRKDAAWA